jgi:hypothetical protein
VEASWAHAFEMQHERAAFSAELPRSEGVDRFLDRLRTIARPVLVHSLEGHRAAALMTLHLALERNLAAGEAAEEGRTLGFDRVPEPLRRFVAAEIDRRRRPAGPSTVPDEADGAAPATPAGTSRKGG